MKPLSGKRKVSGLTLVEVLAVLAILAILVAFLLPVLPAMYKRGGKPPIFVCLSNLKQIGIGFQLYADDNNGKFPMQSFAANGGTSELIQNGKMFPNVQKISKYYEKIANYYGHGVRFLFCPSDVERHAATNWETLNDLNISYFLNIDVSTNNPSLSSLAGDRNLEAVNEPVKPGLFVLTTNVYMRWTDELHTRRGCFLFADGHAQLIGANLNSIIRSQPLATSRLVVP